MESKYLDFAGPRPSESGKTFTWAVCKKGTAHRALAMDNGSALGFVGWYGPWRRYALQPEPGTVFDAACLRDIAAFIEERMAERKAART